jgi:hypothetical protein
VDLLSPHPLRLFFAIFAVKLCWIVPSEEPLIAESAGKLREDPEKTQSFAQIHQERGDTDIDLRLVY